MQIIKPLEISLVHRTFQYQQQYKLSVTAMLGFKFSDPELLLETDLWKNLTQELGAELSRFDSYFPKQHSEFLVYGNFYSPGSQLVQESYAQVKVGQVSKTLAIIGDRHWETGQVSAPVPFKQMPITFEHAFGGSKYKKNPIGKGFGAVKNSDGQMQHLLPNIELVDKRIVAKTDHFDPAGFNALDIGWEPRSLKLGTYDQKWQKKDAPGLAADIDWSAFNTAATDQWFNGFLHGNESFEIKHMHPEHAVLQGQLPPVKVRVFALVNKDFKEINMNLETLLFLPNLEMGILLFRGVAATDKLDAGDVTDLLLAYENRVDTPRDISHYRHQLQERTHPETKFKYALNTVGLIPEGQVCGFQRLLNLEGNQSENYAEQNAQRKLDQEKQQMVEQAKQNITQMAVLQGIDPKKHQAEIEGKAQQAVAQKFGSQKTEDNSIQKLADQIAPINPDQPNKVDLSKIDFERMETLGSEMTQQAQATKAQAIEDLEAQLKVLTAQNQTEGAQIVQQTLVQLRAKTAYPRPEVGAIQTMLDFLKNAPTEQKADLPEASTLQSSRQKIVSSFLQSYRESAHQLTDMQPTQPQNAASQALLAHLAEQKNIQYQDYSGANLAQQTIQHANLSQAFLEELCLDNSCLIEVDLSESVLCNAKLNQTQCTKVNFSDCNLGQAELQGARFTDCNFKNAILEQANLNNTHFNRCNFENIHFLDCSFNQLKIENSQFESADFINVQMQNCSFQKSKFVTCNFLNNQFKSINFKGSDLTSAIFTELKAEDLNCQQAVLNETRFVGGACFKNADFTQVQARKSNFSEAVLNECNFNGADLSQSLFAKAQLKKTTFEESVATLAQFQQADLTQANFQKANLAEISLREARLVNANFNQANLYAAEFFMATFGNTSFHNANLEKTKIEHWRPN